MGILNVDNIQPVGGGTTITLNSSEINVGAGITFESNGQANFAGIVTATHFYGSGANLTGLPAGTTINNNAANRIITGEGGTTLNGEANLLFDGGTLALNGRYQRGSATVQDGDAIAGGININGLDMDASVIMSVFGNDGDFTRISGSKSRNASVGSHTIVQDNDVLLSLKGFGSDGTNFEEAAQIEMQVDGTPGNNVMPGRIVFKTTTTDGVVERVRIKSDGKVVIGNTNGSGTGALTIYPNSITGNGRLDIYGGGDENAQSASKCEVMRIGRGDILDQYYHSIWSATGSGGATSHFLKFYVSNGTAGATNQLEALSMNGNGQVQIPQTTQATTTTTGALKVSGGIGVAKNIICGGTLEVQNSDLIVTSGAPNILMAVPSGGLDSRIFNDGSGNLIIGHGTNSNTPTERLRINSDGYVTHQDGKKCAFNVKGTNMARTNADAYVCEFDDDSSSGCFDSGGDFNTTTHKFVAPVSGYYHFFTNIRLDAYSVGYIRTAILSTSYHAGTSYYEIPSTGHVITYPTNASNIMTVQTSTVMYLPATHEAWVYQNPQNDTSYTVYLNESSFGGYFIG